MTTPWSLRLGTTVLFCTAAWIAGSWAYAGERHSAAKRDQVQQILDATGVTGGLVVLVGCGDGTLAAGLHAGEGFLVQTLDTDAASVEAARRNIQSLGLYGAVTVDRFDGRHLPYVDNLVRLLVSENLGGVPEDEVLRVLAPLGVAYVLQDGEWRKMVKPWPKETDQWTHYLRDASNNAVAHDSVVGPPKTGESASRESSCPNFRVRNMKQTLTLLTVLLLLPLAALHAADAPAWKPNVLLLVVDDLNTWLLGDTNRYAGKVVAPNIQRLAGSGVLFNRAYAAAPVCCPSRTAIFSGVRPWQSGLYDNGLDIGPSVALKKATPLPVVFQSAGYYTGSFGKVGHGWDMKKVWDDYVPHRRDPAPPGAPFLPFTRGEQDWGPTHLAEEKMNDSTYADAAIAQLQKKHDRPFLVACGVFHPHMPWYVPQKYFDLFPLDEVTLPPILKNDLDDVPPLGVAITQGKAKFVDQVMEHNVDKEGVRAYLAATAYADAQMGRVLDALEKSAYRDNTIVMLMSDNGFHLGEKHHWQKSTLWEEASHILLMFRVPGTTKPGGKCERFVSLQDVYRTLAELCALKAPDDVEGRSLVPLLKQPDAAWESTAVTAYGDRYVTIRNERFRYIRYRDGQEELYDCSQDPHEWTNQVHNPEFAPALESLRSKVPPLGEMVPELKRARGGNSDE